MNKMFRCHRCEYKSHYGLLSGEWKLSKVYRYQQWWVGFICLLIIYQLPFLFIHASSTFITSKDPNVRFIHLEINDSFEFCLKWGQESRNVICLPKKLFHLGCRETLGCPWDSEASCSSCFLLMAATHIPSHDFFTLTGMPLLKR